MPQVLNQVERSQSFIKFLIFFLITIVLVVAAVFVNYKLPSEENKKYREQAALQRQYDAEEINFVSKMQEAVGMLDSMEHNSAQSGLLKIQLDAKIGDLEKLEQNEHTLYGKMNKVIVSKLNDLEQTKILLNNDAAKLSSDASLQDDLKQCQAALGAEKKDNDDLRANLRAKVPN